MEKDYKFYPICKQYRESPLLNLYDYFERIESKIIALNFIFQQNLSHIVG